MSAMASDAYFSQVPASRDPGTQDFNISAGKLFDEVVAGSTATFDFNTSAGNGFSGTLNLSASPAISGVTYNFATPSITAGSPATLTVLTSAAVEPGSYLITVTATGGGLTRKSNSR